LIFSAVVILFIDPILLGGLGALMGLEGFGISHEGV
jgi:hypothetical protein